MIIDAYFYVSDNIFGFLKPIYTFPDRQMMYTYFFLFLHIYLV